MGAIVGGDSIHRQQKSTSYANFYYDTLYRGLDGLAAPGGEDEVEFAYGDPWGQRYEYFQEEAINGFGDDTTAPDQVGAGVAADEAAAAAAAAVGLGPVAGAAAGALAAADVVERIALLNARVTTLSTRAQRLSTGSAKQQAAAAQASPHISRAVGHVQAAQVAIQSGDPQSAAASVINGGQAADMAEAILNEAENFLDRFGIYIAGGLFAAWLVWGQHKKRRRA